MIQPSIYRLRLQDILSLCVLALLCLGVIMVHSAAMSLNNATDLPQWHWTERGTKHAMYAFLALITFFIVGHINYTHFARGSTWRNPIMWLLGIAAFTCFLVLIPIPHVTLEVNGARRWIHLGFAQIQPSELGKWAVV
ncbi:MAG: FtsW/RodA/SpoVE family cell cycle protein, partial [Bacillota bacterium]